MKSFISVTWIFSWKIKMKKVRNYENIGKLENKDQLHAFRGSLKTYNC